MLVQCFVSSRRAVPRDVDGAPETEARDLAKETELDDRARAALGGDPTALRSFLGAVVPIVRRVCRGVMGPDNPELEDAIQDCLIEVARALPQFRFEGRASHYVTKIAMRRAIACRQRARALSQQRSTLEFLPFPQRRSTLRWRRAPDLVRQSAGRSERGAGEGAPPVRHARLFDGRDRGHHRGIRRAPSRRDCVSAKNSSAAGWSGVGRAVVQVGEQFPNHPDEELIRRAVRGALDPSDRTALERHLAGCPTCAAELEARRIFQVSLARDGEDDARDREAVERAMAHVAREAALDTHSSGTDEDLDRVALDRAMARLGERKTSHAGARRFVRPATGLRRARRRRGSGNRLRGISHTTNDNGDRDDRQRHFHAPARLGRRLGDRS